MNYYKRILVLVVVAFSLFATEKKILSPTANERRISKLVAQYLQYAHISKMPINDSFSKKLFEEYFNELDSGKLYFYAEDLIKLRPLETTLDETLNAGDVDFAFNVFDIFLKRVKERDNYVKKLLKKPFDFTLNEDLEIDRKNAKWASNEEEMNDLWRKRVKYMFLRYELIDEQLDEKKNDKNVSENEKAELKDEELFPRKTPRERIESYYNMRAKAFMDFTNEDILERYLAAVTRIYDVHTNYMSPSTLEAFNIQMHLSLEGIGATLRQDQGYVRITNVMPGGPAEKSGLLKSGDRIIAVAQENQDFMDIIDMPLDKAVRLIRGKKGTKVRLTIIAGDKGLNSAPKIIELVRDQVEVKESEASGETMEITQEFDGTKQELRIGVITVPSFYSDVSSKNLFSSSQKTVTKDVLKILNKMKQEKIAGLILDLRNNGGGSLAEAINLTGLFIKEGPVVQVASGEGNPFVHRDRDNFTHYDGPLLVMVNSSSASASEIVAGAIQDYGRGIIIGDKKTHGKGTVQSVIDLNNFYNQFGAIFKPKSSGALKFTMQKFYRITGGSTQKKGVTPDLILPSITDCMEIGEDTLPFTLEWDEIEKTKFNKQARNLQVPLLKQLQKNRLEKSEEYKKLLEEIAQYEKTYKEKNVSLNKKVRKITMKEAERMEELLLKTFALDIQDDNKKDKKKKVDFYLKEALAVIGDEIFLNEKVISSEKVYGKRQSEK